MKPLFSLARLLVAAPRNLLGRARWVFLILALGTLGVVGRRLTAMSEEDLARVLVGSLTIAAFAGWWLVGYLRGGFPRVASAVDGLLYSALYWAMPDPDGGQATLALMFRSLYGSSRQVAASCLALVAAILVPHWFVSGRLNFDLPPEHAVLVVSLAPVAGSMYFLRRVLIRQEEIAAALQKANDELDERVRRRTAELEAANQSLRVSEARYRELVENAQDAIFTMDLSGRFLSVNRAVEKWTGIKIDQPDFSMADVVAPEHLAKALAMIRRKLEGAPVTVYEIEIFLQDGRRIPVEVSSWLQMQDGVPVGIQGVARDISERKRLEAQLRQSQKMEAIGMLAGGVAHDFNNLLTAINGFSEMLVNDLGSDSRQGRYAAQINQAGEQAASLTRQLLAFSRRQMLQPKVLNLNAVVRDIEPLLQRLIGEDIGISTSLAPDLNEVKADESQIQQIIANLAVNARDAMPGGGQLTIETRNEHLDEHYGQTHTKVAAGDYASFAITDSGIGMDSATVAQIFEPFFTTKEIGKGTGLGLATVYGIVKQSGGHITVYSEPGSGSCFKIYLPSVVAPAPRMDIGAPPGDDLAFGSVTVLLVEDEQAVRALAREVLVGHGLEVIEASNPAEALVLAEVHGDSIALLLTDVVMPGMNGPDLARALLARWPSLRVVYMSGYADRALIDRGTLGEKNAFISKPFAPQVLVRKIQDVLQGAAKPG